MGVEGERRKPIKRMILPSSGVTLLFEINDETIGVWMSMHSPESKDPPVTIFLSPQQYEVILRVGPNNYDRLHASENGIVSYLFVAAPKLDNEDMYDTFIQFEANKDVNKHFKRFEIPKGVFEELRNWFNAQRTEDEIMAKVGKYLIES